LDRHRLISLVGLGGSGKTRLALEAAARYRARHPGRIWFVDLSATRDPHLVAGKVAAALGREGAGDPREAIAQTVGPTRALLILDNCEQVVEAGAQLGAELRDRCPQLRIVATSRIPLGTEDAVLRVPPLPVEPEGTRSADPPIDPPPAEPEGSGSVDPPPEDAVTLFLDRAAESRELDRIAGATPDSASPLMEQVEADTRSAARAICRRLDGLPLAIELAASWAGMLSFAEILERLDHRTRLLAAGTTPGPAPGAPSLAQRHRALRTVLDETYESLSIEEQALFRRLAVFPAGCTLAALEAVCLDDDGASWQGLDLVRSLMARSLLERRASRGWEGSSRYLMLEVVREYAEERLRDAPLEERHGLLRRQFRWYLDAFSRHDPHAGEQKVWATRFLEEEENLRSLSVAVEEGDDRPGREGVMPEVMSEVIPEVMPEVMPEERAALALSLCHFWIQLGRWREGRERCVGALAKLDRSGSADTAVSIRLGLRAASLSRLKGEMEEARRFAEEALQRALRLADRRLVASCRSELGIVLVFSGAAAQARVLLDECLAEIDESSDPHLYAAARFHRGAACMVTEQIAEAIVDVRESLRVRRALADRPGIATCLNALGRCLLNAGQLAEARLCLEESLALKRSMEDRSGTIAVLFNLWGILTNPYDGSPERRADLAVARAHVEEALDWTRRHGDRPNEARALVHLAATALLEGEPEAAREAAEASLAVPSRARTMDGSAFLVLGHAALLGHDLVEARRQAEQALDAALRGGFRNLEAEVLELAAEIEAHGLTGSGGDARGENAANAAGHAIALVALAGRLREQVGLRATPWNDARLARLRERCRAILGPGDYEESWRRGTDGDSRLLFHL